MLVIDTGPIVAAANRADDDHNACLELLETHSGPLLLPAPLIAEVGYMLATRAGAAAEAGFLRDVADGLYTPIPVDAAQARRAAELVEKYADLPLGTSDAFVIAVAEQFGAREVATLDHRHFHAIRPAHAEYLTLLP